MWSWLNHWINTVPILVIGVTTFALMLLSLVVGSRLRSWRDATEAAPAQKRRQEAENTTVTAMLTLLALLLGFSFDLAMERFEARRMLVVEEAGAIDTAYLRAQVLPEPHRRRISDILFAYTDNRIRLAAFGMARRPDLLAKNDALLTDLSAATSAALASIDRPDFSNAFLAAMNRVPELDVSRKSARLIHIPGEIFLTLLAYLIVTAGLLGYVWGGLQSKLLSGIVLFLMAAFLLLIIDIDRPMEGAVRESQEPMELVRARLAADPPYVFDRYKPLTSSDSARPVGRSPR